MMQNHPSGAWLRALSGLFVALALVTLAGCGGGSGAPNNPYAPVPALLTITPPTVDAYSGMPTTLTVGGGTPPFRAFSSNSGVLPVAQAMAGSTLVLVPGSIDADTPVQITIQDSGGQSAVATVTVHAQQPVALSIVPAAPIAYSGIASTFTIVGGVPPYRATSSNPGVLPVASIVPGNTVILLAANVNADTPVDVTIQDATGQRATATVSVRAAPLLNSLTITPSGSDCGASAICSGQNGTAVVTVLGAGGGALAGRQVRFDVLAGPYGITTPSSPQTVVTTLTVTSDADGKASVLIKANVNAPTQFSQLKVTDLTSGQQLIGNFLIQQVTNGAAILTVVPATATINAFFVGDCSSGARVDYYIYGGTPPYRVTSTFPDAVTIINQVVNASGGFFEAVTNGQCVNPLTFSIVDATGRQTTATLINAPGTNPVPVVPIPDLAVSPATYLEALCTSKTFPFLISGGTPPYNVSASNGAVDPATVTTSGGTTRVSGLLTGSGLTSVLVQDSSPAPGKSFTATIICSTATSPALSASPVSYTSTSCTGNSFPIAIVGGTPPYNVSSTRGVATPPVVNASGGTTTITGLVTGTGITAVVILDQSVPQKSVGVNITCDPSPAAPAPPALNVTTGFDYTTPNPPGCVGQISNFAITGGTPPYSVFFAAPVPAAGTITPTTVAASGLGFSVTGLTNAGGAGVIRYITVSDSGTVGGTQQQAIRSIKCP